jgi:hypothetical protein
LIVWWTKLTSTSKECAIRQPDHVLGGKAQTDDVAYAVAALIDSIESVPAESDMPSRYCH